MSKKKYTENEITPTKDYNELFNRFNQYCVENSYPNAFLCLDFYDLDYLNRLFDRLLVFFDNINEEEIEDLDGEEVIKLRDLIYDLFDRSIIAEHKIQKERKEK